MTLKQQPFIIRVYGIAIHDGHLLVCDEYWFDTLMTKLPGGGMEYGEGTRACLQRECMEELGQEVDVLEHVYTADFFQEARFVEGRQLISIYYRIKLPEPGSLEVSDRPFDFPEKREGAMRCRWVPLQEVSEDIFTFPIDKKVAGMLSDLDITGR